MTKSKRYGRMESPVGRLTVGGDGEGLRVVEFERKGDRADAAARRGGADWIEDDGAPIVRDAIGELAAYFEGRLRRFTVEVAMEGTAFEVEAWEALRGIGYGEAISYGEQARRMGRGPESARAVGAANGRNPVAIVVPCHRVIGADGRLVGFGGGLDVKRWLLEHESKVCGRVGLFESEAVGASR